MQTLPYDSVKSAAHIEPFTLDHIPDVQRIQAEFVSSKKLCCCIPIADSESDMTQNYSTHPDRMELAAVAVVDGATAGFVHMTTRGVARTWFDEFMQPSQEGEFYIESIAVTAGQRGRGIGQKLLEWCEATARERGGTKLTLGVINANPARKLYERFGFTPAPTTSCGNGLTVLKLLVVFGQPYGWCPPAFGGVIMEKDLEPV
jgi:ribosomal protein S18 acetylase RimI-like enzyme